MDNGITVLGQAIKAQTLRKVAIWFGVIGVLLCSIVGSGILSMQEGARPLGTRQPPASTQVVIVPPHTSTAVSVTTATPAFVATWTPSPTVTGAAGSTATSTATFVATSTAAAPAAATPTSAPISAPTVVLLPPTPDCVLPAGWLPYTVRSGDTLTGLAWRTGTTVAAIVQANCLSTTTIYAGRTLYLPTPPAVPTPLPTRCAPNPPPGWVIYVVRVGDTLFGLAIRHGTYLARIQQVNCLPGTGLLIGQHIYLPYIPPTATTQVPPTPVPTATLFPTWTATATPALTLTPPVTAVPTPTMTLVPTTTPVATTTIIVPTPTVAPSTTVAPTETVTLVPSPTIAPTQTSELTPVPTETLQVPTETATPELPTATVTPPQPGTATVAPTATPVSTPTPISTATALPTATLIPAATPVPTATPVSTQPPVPTPTRGLSGITPPPPTVPPAPTPTATTGA